MPTPAPFFSMLFQTKFVNKHNAKYAVLRIVPVFILLFFVNTMAFADTVFTARLDGIQSVPSNASAAAGIGSVILNNAENQVTVTLYRTGLSGGQTSSNIHGPAARGVSAASVFVLPNGNFTQTFPVNASQASSLKAGMWYFNIATVNFLGGEIRGQIEVLAAPDSFGLAAWYSGEANSNDGSSNLNNGSLQNGAGYGYGKIGHAFAFDGVDDNLQIPDAASLDITQQITLQAWINPASTAGGRIIDKRTPGGNDGYSFEVSNGTLLVSVGNRTFQTTAYLPPNDWSHVAATFDGLRLRIYVNGQLRGRSGELSGAIPVNGIPLRIGSDSTASANFFSGLIDEVRIYNRALSHEEIVDVLNSIPFPGSNGSLDPTFDGDGILNTEIGGGNNVAQAVAIQADGKILVAGYAAINGINDFAIARYNPNGLLDSTFDGDGVVTTPVGSSQDQGYGLAIQPDGKIILAGEVISSSSSAIGVVRYNSNGSLDTTFSKDGIVMTSAGDFNFARSVAVQPDGRILVAGNTFNGSNDDILVIRYMPDGALDPSFVGNSGTGNGIVTTAVGPGNDEGYGVRVQNDGKIVMAGYYFNGTNNDVAVLRYNTNGVLDTSFDGDGIVTSAAGTGTDEALSLTLQPDGKIVIGGCTNSGAGNDFLVIRYLTNGAPDPSFSSDGITVTPIGNAPDIALGVAVQPDGKIVAAGFSRNASNNNDFGVIRLNPDGTLDSALDGDGRLTTPIGVSTDTATAVAIQPDGKIVAAGRTVIGSTADFGVVRYGYGTNTAANDGYATVNVGTAVRFENAYLSGTNISTSLDRLAIPALPAGLNLAGTPRYIRTSANFDGDVLVKFTLPANVASDAFNSAQILQFENGSWVDRTSATPARDFATRTIYARVSSLLPLAAVSSIAPAASNVSVTGRIVSADGRGVFPTILTITNSKGIRQYTVTNPFGYYRFNGVAAGDTYLMNIASKRQKVAPRVLSPVENVSDFDLTAEPF